MYIRRRLKGNDGVFIERTEETNRYDKVIHYNYNGTGKKAYLVTYRQTDKNIIRRFWVSTQPNHDPPADMDCVNEINVMNNKGEIIEVISN